MDMQLNMAPYSTVALHKSMEQVYSYGINWYIQGTLILNLLCPCCLYLHHGQAEVESTVQSLNLQQHSEV